MHRVRAAASIALASILAPLSAPAVADLYAFTDGAGRTIVTDKPPAGDTRYKLFLRSPEDYKLKDVARFRNVRNPGDYRLRAPWGRLPDPLENPALAGKPYQAQVIEAAKEHNVDPALVYAVISAESNYNPAAVSDKGAIGLMQVMPDTGRRFGVKEKDLKVPKKNIDTGTKYLAELLTMFDGDLKLAVAAYNAGENTVLRYGKTVPPFAETLAYVPRVLRAYEALRVK